MFQNKTVAVVVPAFNEEGRIAETIRRVPSWVDRIIVIDDHSRDRTLPAAREVSDPRVKLVSHRTNRGVGGAILTGYRSALEERMDISVVMAGDGQMDPDDLPALISPVASGRADYVKGNRFLHHDTLRVMPKLRLAGNLALSYLTRVASGYACVMDSQCGYTAVSTEALRKVELEKVYPRYGFPNDFLAHMHSAGARMEQVEVRPVYEGQRSGINPVAAVLPLAYVLARSLVFRLAREVSPPKRGT